MNVVYYVFFFFFQAEDGIRDADVTGVQTCALPIFRRQHIKFDSEPGVEIEGNLYIPSSPSGRKPAVLLVAEKSSFFPAPSPDFFGEKRAKKGPHGLSLETPGFPRGNNPPPFFREWVTNIRANQDWP